MKNEERVIGRVIGVEGVTITVELEADVKSAARSYIDGIEMAILMNAFVTFELGGGQEAIGIITGLSSKQSFEAYKQDLNLELVKPMRIAWVQLLGTINEDKNVKKTKFSPGVSELPTLDTKALIPDKKILNIILEEAPKMNRPSSYFSQSENYDSYIELGSASGLKAQSVNASFNDILSRPLAVLGNTGAGKSYTIAHILQVIKEYLKSNNEKYKAKVFIFDINGEYSKALNLEIPKDGKEPNKVYVNGKEFGVPIWLWSLYEVNHLFRTSEQAQEPVLNRLILNAKRKKFLSLKSYNINRAYDAFDYIRMRIANIEEVCRVSNRPKQGAFFVHNYSTIISELEYIKSVNEDIFKILNEIYNYEEIKKIYEYYEKKVNEPKGEWYKNTEGIDGENSKKVEDWCREFKNRIIAKKNDFEIKNRLTIIETGDIPEFFSAYETFKDIEAFKEASRAIEDQRDISQHLAGLHLRIQEKLNDKRWQFIFNYEKKEFNNKWRNLEHWLKCIGLSEEPSSDLPITVFDCSMLGHDILPFFCGVVGRLLLDLRQHILPSERFYEPWVVVLEEAHNYIFPYRQDESRGVKVSRETFERIAKEGRKFGLSLIIASQRPSDVSGTILSQCSNFIVHRLQNPADIEHFREMIPAQSKKILDQVTILTPGEALIFGSAVHVPSKVQITCPEPPPQSDSSCPYLYWLEENLKKRPFPIKEAISHWLGTYKDENKGNSDEDEKQE
jgi:uncharacterized protein